MATIINILLTGASGTVGQELLKCLVGNPEFRITVFDIDSRRAGRLRSVYQHRIVFVAGDISSAADVQKIPAGMDVVIHLAALIPPLADKYPLLTHNINVLGTSLLVEHVQRTSPNAFFIYSSSVSVYGDRMQNPNIRVSDVLSVSEGDVYGQPDDPENVKLAEIPWEFVPARPQADAGIEVGVIMLSAFTREGAELTIQALPGPFPSEQRERTCRWIIPDIV